MIEILAERDPVADGLNTTLIVQFVPVPRVAGEIGHVLVRLKSPGFAPVTVRAVMVSGMVPVSISVTLCTVLLEPRF